ncbi:MAG: UPF0280 family protein [Spirochaetes bacterium]|nr:UPF0280 family protein [Spirochaetota bacterium]
MSNTLPYRTSINSRFTTFEVRVETTNLFICAHSNLYDRAIALVKTLRTDIERYINTNPQFLHALTPLQPSTTAPEVVGRMYQASMLAGVGPMAAVAGAIAQMVGESLIEYSPEIIVENGGDIWAYIQEPATVSVFAGRSAFSKNLGLALTPEMTPCGICSSSGRFGRSFSFGKADIATIIATDAALADAVATATCNMVQSDSDCAKAVSYATSISGVKGALVIYWDTMAVKGEIKLTEIL